VVSVGLGVQLAVGPIDAAHQQPDRRVRDDLRVAHEIDADLPADAAIVRPAGQLDRAASLIAAAISRLGVAEIRAALVATLRLRRPPNLLHEPEAAALMTALAHEVNQAKAAIEDAVGAEVDVGCEAQLL